jgi:hypothetical protein
MPAIFWIGEGTMFKQSKLIGLSITILLALSGSAVARERDDSYNAKQYAYQAGYQDGVRFGEDARAQGYRYDYKNSEDYRRADRGYDRSMGEHDDFQKNYRNGYKTGYNDGYNGRRNSGYYGNDQGSRNYGYDPYSRDPRSDPYGGYGNGRNRYGYTGGAQDFGYRDGRIIGEKDRRNGKEFRPEKNENYEDANHGYRREFGNKNFYKEQYRQAFVQGYEEAYGR